MTDRLKPCPFCGKGFRNLFGTWYEHDSVDCTLKGIKVNIENDIQVGRWNTRKPMDRIVEQLEEAKGKPYTDGVHTYNENDFIDIDKAIEIVKGEE